jgi:hypothetical protein
MTLGVNSASNRNVCQESAWGVKGRPARGDANLIADGGPIIYRNVGASTSHNSVGLQGLLQEVIGPFFKRNAQSCHLTRLFLVQVEKIKLLLA